MIGQTISHYYITEKLGSGGMGVVYKAEDRRLRLYVALKFVPDELARNPEAMTRFRQEMLAASALNHPNICTIHDVGEREGQAFMVMEFLEGQTLSDRLGNGPLPDEEIVEHAVQMAEALEAAHAKNIIHRDIKPENVFLTTHRQIKLLDFGLAKVVEDSRQLSQAVSPDSRSTGALLTFPGAVLGTPSYMSPEQARGEELDERTDLFSFGVVLYQMATGRLAFAGSTPALVYNAILNHSPTPPTQLNRALSPGMGRVIMKALQKDRGRRYQSAKELLEDLRRVQRRRNHGDSAGLTLAQGSRTSKAIASIAVLPFANSGADPQTEYLSDGVSETILNSLSSLPRLRVIARSTAFRYRSRELDPQAVGRELRVQAVVVGRLLDRAGTVTIDTELVDVANGWRLWANEYRRPASEIIGLQDEIAQSISENLRRKLTVKDQERLKKRYTEDPEAYRTYLKGLYHWNKRSEDGIRKAIEYFRQAIDLDPTYAQSYAGLADCYLPLSYTAVVSPAEAYQQATALVKKALEIDDTLAQAHTVSGIIKLFRDRNWLEAERELRMATELNQNYSRPHQVRAEMLSMQGRDEAALREIQRALEIDPLSLANNAICSFCFYYARRYDECIQEAGKTLELDANFFYGLWALGVACAHKRDFPKAIAELDRTVELTNENSMLLGILGAIHAMREDRDTARQILRRLDEIARQKYVSPSVYVPIYARIGDRDRAFEHLEEGLAEKSPRLLWVNVEPLLDPLRDDPRFPDLVRRVGLDG